MINNLYLLMASTRKFFMSVRIILLCIFLQNNSPILFQFINSGITCLIHFILAQLVTHRVTLVVVFAFCHQIFGRLWGSMKGTLLLCCSIIL